MKVNVLIDELENEDLKYLTVEQVKLNYNKLLVAVTKNYSKGTIDFDCYYKLAVIGLFKAVEQYNSSKGVKFQSLAMWYILREINIARNKTNI